VSLIAEGGTVPGGAVGIGAAEYPTDPKTRDPANVLPQVMRLELQAADPRSVVGDLSPTIGADMSAAPAPSFLKRTVRRRASVRPERPSPRTAWSSEGLHRVEIVAPDPECAALLLEYASPLFPAELITGPAPIVRLQPPSTGPVWVIELLALVERWLESVPLPCASVLYGGRSYLIRSSTRVAQFAVVEPASAATS
jgi:hypothetical protein